LAAHGKVFDSAHASDGFVPWTDDATAQDLLPVNKSSDMFKYSMTTRDDLIKLNKEFNPSGEQEESTPEIKQQSQL